MTIHNKTLHVCYTALALALCTLSIGCSDDSKDSLAETMASLIASGNCVDQEPLTLSGDNQEVSVGNFTLSVGDPASPVTFVPSLCKVPNNQIKNNDKTSPASQILYLKNVNLGSLINLPMNVSLETGIQGINGFVKYVPAQQALSADSSQRSDNKGNVIAAANLQGNTAFVGMDVSIAQSENVGNLAFGTSSFASAIITKGCEILVEATSITLEEGNDITLPVNLDIFGIGGKGPDSTCTLLKKAKLDKKCDKISNKFTKKACNAIFSKFTQTLVCLSMDDALETIAGFVPISTESCSDGNLLSQCLRESGAQMCTILTPLLTLAAG